MTPAQRKQRDKKKKAVADFVQAIDDQLTAIIESKPLPPIDREPKTWWRT